MCILVGKVKQTNTYMWKVRKQNKAGRAKRTAYRVKATAVQRKKRDHQGMTYLRKALWK